MKKKISLPTRALFKIANNQMGYFTAGQAQRAGIRGSNHAYHIRAGHWKREMPEEKLKVAGAVIENLV